MQTNYDAIQEAGAQVVSVVVATLTDVDGWCQRAALPYPMLADPDHQVSEAYGVYDLRGDGRAAPAVFVIGTDGRVIWSRVAPSTTDPASAASILEQLP